MGKQPHPSTTNQPHLRLDVDIDVDAKRVLVSLTDEVHSDRAELPPLTANEARVLASNLLVAARDIDPTGHYNLIARIGQEVKEHVHGEIVLEAFRPAPSREH